MHTNVRLGIYSIHIYQSAGYGKFCLTSCACLPFFSGKGKKEKEKCLNFKSSQTELKEGKHGECDTSLTWGGTDATGSILRPSKTQSDPAISPVMFLWLSLIQEVGQEGPRWTHIRKHFSWLTTLRVIIHKQVEPKYKRNAITIPTVLTLPTELGTNMTLMFKNDPTFKINLFRH